MVPEGSLPHLQVPATCPYPEPDQSSPCPQSHFLILSFHLRLVLPSGLFPTGSPPKPYIHLSPPSYALHAPPISAVTVFGKQYRSLNSSLCSVLPSPVTSSLLRPNIFLSTLIQRSSLNVSVQVSHPFETTGKIIVRNILISAWQALVVNHTMLLTAVPLPAASQSLQGVWGGKVNILESDIMGHCEKDVRKKMWLIVTHSEWLQSCWNVHIRKHGNGKKERKRSNLNDNPS